MACCLTVPNHYLNQCWLLISKDLLHSPESNFIVSAEAAILCNGFENLLLKLLPHLPGVNELMSLFMFPEQASPGGIGASHGAGWTGATLSQEVRQGGSSIVHSRYLTDCFLQRTLKRRPIIHTCGYLWWFLGLIPRWPWMAASSCRHIMQLLQQYLLLGSPELCHMNLWPPSAP